jgi:hypothetical protein
MKKLRNFRTADLRVSVVSDGISADGFDISFSTWSDSQIWSVGELLRRSTTRSPQQVFSRHSRYLKFKLNLKGATWIAVSYNPPAPPPAAVQAPAAINNNNNNNDNMDEGEFLNIKFLLKTSSYPLENFQLEMQNFLTRKNEEKSCFF